MRIAIHDMDDITFNNDKDAVKKLVVYSRNQKCKSCDTGMESIMLSSTSSKTRRGTTALLYVARIQGQDVLMCPKCVSAHAPLLQYGGRAVAVYNYDRGCIQADKGKINKATGVITDTSF